MFNKLKKIVYLALILSSTLFADQEAPYSKIRSAIILPENFESRITRLDDLTHNPDFQTLIEGKVRKIAPNVQFFAYSSESVDDTEWGCAWRAIQTSLSSHFHGDVSKVPTFKDLYETYGGRSFLEKGYLELYGDMGQTWLAPHQEWHMWADPFVGQMILRHFKSHTKLIALNQIVPSNSPAVAEKVIDFKTFRRMLFVHFWTHGNPLVIDNGKYAMNILGFGFKQGHTFLLIGDPHLNFDRDANPLNGLYVVELDQNGKQVSLDYPAVSNHFDHESYQSLNFDSSSSWMILFSRD